jgi:long-chain fatty acid transport protein
MRFVLGNKERIRERDIMSRFVMRHLISALCVTGAVGLSSTTFASAFQLWEQDGASIGNYHAGYAAEAADASTAWYNPAGITRFKNQQAVFAADAILTSFKYRGSVAVAEKVLGIIPVTYNSPNVTAQGGQFSIVPSLHYVAPISDRLGFGFSVTVPFGLKTNYGNSTPLRYAATLTSITVIDISPSLAYKFTDKASAGLGFDIQRAYAEFDNTAVALIPSSATEGIPIATGSSENKANDTAYGFHAGLLYEFTPDSRIGLSYHSQVVHQFTGYSQFSGPIANGVPGVGGPIRSGHANTRVTLPPYTALSFYHRLKPTIALMGSIIYTQWNSFKTLNLQNVAGVVTIPPPNLALLPSKSISISVPEHYRNTWNITFGANYNATDKIMLRAGVGFDETPITNRYRNVQLPDNNRYVIALGTHYQASKTIGVDLGWTHFFFAQAHVSPPPQVTAGQTVTTNGHVTGGADVIGGQIVWDIV